MITREVPPQSLVILGAAGGGQLMYWYVRETWPDTKICFVDDNWKEDTLDIAGTPVPVLNRWEFEGIRASADASDPEPFQYFMLSPTEPRIKKILVAKALAAGLRPAPPLIHPTACIHGPETVSIGRGSLIATRVIVHGNARIGDYVHVASAAMFGHDVSAGDYVSISPGCVVLGYVTLGEGVMLGAGTVVRGYVTIAPQVTTGLLSGVVKNIVEPGVTVVGVPARPLKSAEHLRDA